MRDPTSNHRPQRPATTSLPRLIAELMDDLPGLISDRVHLFTLELRRASRSLVMVLALCGAAVLLLATAWLALWLGIAAALYEQGLSPAWSAFGALAVNAALAAIALKRVLRLTPLLRLPATVRHLTRGSEDLRPSAGAATEAEGSAVVSAAATAAATAGSAAGARP